MDVVDLSQLDAAFREKVLHEGRDHHRDVLAATFWPEADEASARNRLSSTLWRLRRALAGGRAAGVSGRDRPLR